MQIGRYDVELDIDFDGLSYSGTESIHLTGNGEKLFLNSVGLEILGMKVSGKDIKFRINEKDQTVETDYSISGNQTIEVIFKGKVSEALHGIYDAKYNGGHMITTQFESTGTRRAFPCIDHPSYKAVFSLTLIVNDKLDVVSNMPVKSQKSSGTGKKTVTFDDTPRMSTYLLYLGIGHFDSVKRKIGRIEGILTAPKGMLRSTDFPLVEAENFIHHYEKYYGIDYVLPKLHLISVPEFSAGAMENWGAITFREILLLVNENTSINTRMTISEVIAHEIAHQWFGNLVTMEWWNDLWLNESFATFMAFKAVDKLHPEWKMTGKFLLTETAGALTGDALANSHPIDADVKSPDDIAQIFDEISYGKGGSILRMIEGYVGEENFRKGIQEYLKSNKFENAKGMDLWTSIEGASGMPVSRIMEAWIKRKGYPVLRASKSDGKIRVTQEQFLFNGKSGAEPWPVPLTVLRGNGTQSVLMDKREILLDPKDFIKLNAAETGFYRVVYDDELMKAILANKNKLSYLDVWGLVNDLFANLRAGKIRLKEYISSLTGFMDFTDFTVVQEISSQLTSLSLILSNNAEVKRLSTGYFKGHLTRLGLKKDGEEENTSILRGSLATSLSIFDPEYAKEKSLDFANFFKVDPDLRSAVAIGYARSRNDFSALESTFSNATSDEDKLRLLMGLSWLKGENNFSRLLELTDTEKVKKQDSLRVYMYASMNPEYRSMMFNNVRKAVDQVEQYFQGTGYTGMMLESMIPFIGLGREPEVRKEFSKISNESFAKGINKGLELLEINLRLLKESGS